MANYVLTSKMHSELCNFYINVSKKYRNTYDYNDMSRDINRAYDAIYQIEDGLLRRQPTLSRWNGLFMANSNESRSQFGAEI